MNHLTNKSQQSIRIFTWDRWLILIIIGLSIWFYLWGIQRNLPFTYEVDETVFVRPALQMAATGDLNPGWFGHPGSTFIYSLASVYHLWDFAIYDGVLFHANPNVQTRFEANFSEFYLLGRILSVAFGVLGVFMTYKLGQSAFGKRVGLIGAWLALIAPSVILLTRYLRTDSASIFFSALGLWLCLELYERPTTKNQILAGIGIGLSIATKYYLVTLIPVFMAVNILSLRNQNEKNRFAPKWLGIGGGLLAIGVSFALITPYFFLDFATVRASLLVMGHSVHLGHDGLSFWGNLLWYLRTAITQIMYWPQAILIIIGLVILLFQRRIKPLLLVGYAALFLVVISMHSLHWARWLFPIWPVLTLLAAFALDSFLRAVNGVGKLSNWTKGGLGFVAVVFISAQPMYQVLLLNIRHANPTTRILAREWMIDNLPADSVIAQENYTAPLSDTTFSAAQYPSLVADGRSLVDYHEMGFRYLMVSSNMYNRYLAEPERYPKEVDFYHTLFEETHLLQMFEPSPFADAQLSQLWQPSSIQGGPTIRIYALNKP